MKNVAIVLAAGQGKRMNSSIQKQFLLIKEKPVLYYSLHTFQESPLIHEIILVTGREEIAYCKEEIVEKYGFSKVTKVVEGGKERYDSVFCGLNAIGQCDYVYIHDGARPFINEEMIQNLQVTVEEEKACVAGMPVKDTIKIVDEGQHVTETPVRDKVWIVQTPQVFSYSLVKGAYTQYFAQDKTGATDDAMVVERMTGHKVKLVKADYRNIKITTPEDLQIAEVFCGKK